MLFDSHSHLDATEFDGDRTEVLARALAAGVTQQLVPAVDFASWPKLKSVAAMHPSLHPAYGLHPMYLERHRPEHVDALPGWISSSKDWMPRHSVGISGGNWKLPGSSTCRWCCTRAAPWTK